MQSVTFPHGVTIAWDDTLTVGELVTAYEKGYHVITGFEFREGHPPLVYYRRVVSSSGKKIKGKGSDLSCDASYVQRVTYAAAQAIYHLETQAAAEKFNNLLEFVTQ